MIVEREQLTPTAGDDPSDLGSSEVDVENVSGDTSTADGSELGSSSDGLMLGEMGGVIEDGEKMVREGGGERGAKEERGGEKEGEETKTQNERRRRPSNSEHMRCVLNVGFVLKLLGMMLLDSTVCICGDNRQD